MRWVLRTFVDVVSHWLRRRARAQGIRGALKNGGVTVVQRFGSDLNRNFISTRSCSTGSTGSARAARPTGTRVGEEICCQSVTSVGSLWRARGAELRGVGVEPAVAGREAACEGARRGAGDEDVAVFVEGDGEAVFVARPSE